MACEDVEVSVVVEDGGALTKADGGAQMVLEGPRGSSGHYATASHRRQVTLPPDPLQCEHVRMDVGLMETSGSLRPRLHFDPVPSGLTGHRPAGLRHPLAVLPGRTRLGFDHRPLWD